MRPAEDGDARLRASTHATTSRPTNARIVPRTGKQRLGHPRPTPSSKGSSLVPGSTTEPRPQRREGERADRPEDDQHRCRTTPGACPSPERLSRSKLAASSRRVETSGMSERAAPRSGGDAAAPGRAVAGAVARDARRRWRPTIGRRHRSGRSGGASGARRAEAGGPGTSIAGGSEACRDAGGAASSSVTSPRRAGSRRPPELAEPAHLDVPARQHDRHPLAVADRDPAREDRRQRGRTGRLEDLLEPLEREPQPGEDRRVVEQHDVVDVAPGHRQRPRAGERRAEAVGDARGWIVTTSPRSSASDIASEPIRLHPDDPDRRAQPP